MATATTADFLGQGGDIANPFSTTSAPSSAPTQAEQDAAAAARSADPNSPTNRANSAFYQSQAPYDPSKGPQDMSAWDKAFYKDDGGVYRNRVTGEPMSAVQQRIMDDQYGGFLSNAAKTIAQHPYLLALPAAPFAVAGLGAEVTGSTVAGQLGFGGADVAADAAAAGAPAITTGGATEVPTLAAPAATGATAPVAATAAATSSPFWSAAGANALGAGVNLAGHLAVDAIAGGKTDADKALIAKQAQLASEAAARRDQGSQAAMDMMAQRMLAFAPMNNYLAMIGGQGNALSPQTVAGMVQNPYPPQLDPSLQNYQGNDPSKIQEIQSYQQRMAQYQAAESARSQAIQQGFPPPPPQAGTPMMPPPMAPKKYF